MTIEEIKQKAWKMAVEGFKTDLDKEWQNKLKATFPNDMASTDAQLLYDLIELYYGFKSGKYTKDQTQSLSNGFIAAYKGGYDNEE